MQRHFIGSLAICTFGWVFAQSPPCLADSLRPALMRPMLDVQNLVSDGAYAAADQKLATIEATGNFTPFELQKVREFRLFIDIKLDRKNKIVEEYRVLHGGQLPPGTAAPVSKPATATASATAVPVESNVADAFHKNLAAGVARYSNWQSATMTFGDMKFEDGHYGVSWNEVPSTVTAAQNERSTRKISISEFRDGIVNGVYANVWALTCIFPGSSGSELAKIPSGTERVVQIRIKAAADHNAVFDCKL